jgi:hypothetical protein
MSKWQLTLIQNGKKLRKFGGTKGDVKWETERMTHWLEHYDRYKQLPYALIKDVPCQFVVSKYNNPRTKKKIIMEVRNFE